MMYELNPNHILLQPGEKEIEQVGYLTCIDIGQVHFPTGEVCAVDAFMLDEPPLIKKIAPGHYSVLLNLLKLPNDDERVAYAVLKCSDKPVVEWEIATNGTQNLETLIGDEYYGYSVDTGTGSFVDAETLAKLKEFEMQKYREDNDFLLVDELDKELQDNYKHTRTWLIKTFPNIGDVSYFSSGYGDGVYPSYWGLDEDGEVACLVTDFLVVDE